MKSTQDPENGEGRGWKNPTQAAAGRRVGRLGNSLLKDIPLHNERWSVPFLTLWKILARCWGCPLSPLPSFYIILAIISEKDALCHKHKRNVIPRCFAGKTLINLIDFMSVKMVNRQLVCVMFRRHQFSRVCRCLEYLWIDHQSLSCSQNMSILNW